MSIQSIQFGTTKDGRRVEQFTLTNRNGLVAKVMTWGATLTELCVPDRSGAIANVVLGFNNFAQYEAGHPFFGSTAGRVANRIAGGRFILDGAEHRLAINNGPNSLHGGNVGFDKVLWSANPKQTADGPALELAYLSPDGEEGYPGNLSVRVTYTLTDADELRIDYLATTDKRTPVNLTNHTYFNFAGPGAGDALGHVLAINADHYTPVDATLIPTGAIAPVAGTPLDFRTPTPIGARIAQAGGYDHNFVLNKPRLGELTLAAAVFEPTSGRRMEVFSTEPGVQLYTGNFLDGKLRGPAGVYNKHGGFCLELQHFPDSVHHPNFPSVILDPGREYRQTTTHRFSR